MVYSQVNDVPQISPRRRATFSPLEVGIIFWTNSPGRHEKPKAVDYRVVVYSYLPAASFPQLARPLPGAGLAQPQPQAPEAANAGTMLDLAFSGFGKT